MRHNDFKNIEKEYLMCLKEYEENVANGIKMLDWIIITATNNEQQRKYELEINKRKATNSFLANVRIDVLIDTDGMRIGSGGALLNALMFICKEDKYWKNRKILLINSGGESKRMPHATEAGKIFVKIPRNYNNNVSTLFDELVINYSLLFKKLKPGILIASGDVITVFDYKKTNIIYEDALGFSIKTSVEIGKNHGVFIVDNNKLVKFMHKRPVLELKEHGALDNQQLINIDTGIVWLSNAIMSNMVELLKTQDVFDKNKIELYLNDDLRLNFYEDFLFPLATQSNLKEYLNLPSEGKNRELIKQARIYIWKAMSKFNLNVTELDNGYFFHLGTTCELLDFYKKYPKINSHNFNDKFNSKIDIRNNNESIFINSFVENSCTIGENSYIENSYLKNAKIGNNCIIISNYFTGVLEDNTVFHLIPLKMNGNNFYVVKIYSIFDNPKDNKIFGVSLEKILKNVAGCYDFESKTLWNARLYEVCHDKKEALNSAFRLLKIINGNATKNEFNIWKNAKRISFDEISKYVDYKKIEQEQSILSGKIIGEIILDEYFYKKTSLDNCLNKINETDFKSTINYLTKIKNKNKYRMNFLISRLCLTDEKNANKSRYFEDKCFKELKNLMLESLKKYQINSPKNDVLIKKPVRVNFAGGWSDTPPYCLEQGGTVLNAAIYLNGKLPIEVTVKKYCKGKYRFKSIDIESEKEFDSIADLQVIDTLNDPFILFKLSLKCLGITESDLLKEYGIEIITNVNVPLGSGLGTSSILASALVEAITKFYDIKITKNEIFDIVLKIEQMATTGGGWQDQIGGFEPGIKFIKTNPGINQIFNIEYLPNNSNIQDLQNRMCLIYTGRTRKAKNLVRKMMIKYMNNDFNFCSALTEIQKIANLMRYELLYGNIDKFASLMTRNFEIVKQIDKGISNEDIEEIINKCLYLLEGYTILGAGGGGFIFVILKKEASKMKLIECLKRNFSNTSIAMYDCSFMLEE